MHYTSSKLNEILVLGIKCIVYDYEQGIAMQTLF